MSNIEKAGPLGVLFATAGCPACFPAIAGVASAMGLTVFQGYEGLALKLVQLFIILSMVLAYFTYKRNKFKPTLIMTEVSGLIMLVSFFTGYITIYYIFLVPLIGASIGNYIIDRKIPSCKDGSCDLKCGTKYNLFSKYNIMETKHYDIAILGGGSGAFASAINAANKGKDVVVIEGRKDIGGTCLNRGCVPSKHLLRASEIYNLGKKQPFEGFDVSSSKLDYKKVIENKRKLLDFFRKQKYEDIISTFDNISLIKGYGTFLDNKTLQIGDENVTFDKAIIATGGEPSIPPYKGIEDIEYLDSTSALDMDSLPKSLLVVGGRAVGLELGQVFHNFGVNTIIFQRSEHIIPNFDIELSIELEKSLKEDGMNIKTGINIKEFQKLGDNIKVIYEENKQEKKIIVEKVLFGTGKKPNTSKIGLGNVNIKTNKKGNIIVDKYMKTDEDNIYAIGDVVGNTELVTVSAAEGNNVIENIFENANKSVDYSLVPSSVFTSPNAGFIGLGEKQAIDLGYEVEVRVLPYSKIPKAAAVLDTRGAIKMIADKKTKIILGIQLIGESGSETIQLGIFILQNKMTYIQVAESIFVYPTFSESIKMVAQTFTKDISKLSCCA